MQLVALVNKFIGVKFGFAGSLCGILIVQEAYWPAAIVGVAFVVVNAAEGMVKNLKG